VNTFWGLSIALFGFIEANIALYDFLWCALPGTPQKKPVKHKSTSF